VVYGKLERGSLDRAVQVNLLTHCHTFVAISDVCALFVQNTAESELVILHGVS